MNTVYVIGASGFSCEVIEALTDGYPELKVAGVFDDDTRVQDQNHSGLPYLGVVGEFLLNTPPDSFYVLAVGDNAVRERLDQQFRAENKHPFSVIHPAAVVSPAAVIGPGAYIAAFAFVGPRAQIGRLALLNVGCSVGHNSILEDYVQVCPGGRVSGHARIGRGAFIASNAVVPPNGRVGQYGKVAANSFAVRPVPDHSIVVGVPGRPM